MLSRTLINPVGTDSKEFVPALRFSMILRKTMIENPQTTSAFMNAGGLRAEQCFYSAL